MTDFNQFERGLAAALRLDADESISRFDPSLVARAAISSHRRRPARAPWSARTINYARFAVAATVAVLAVSGAFYLFGPTRHTFGPSGPPEPSPSSATSASQAPTGAPATLHPAIGSWTLLGSMTEARSGHTATLLPDAWVLITGGDAGLTSAELFQQLGESGTATGSMTQARLEHTATLLTDGRVLVAGGLTGPHDVPASVPPSNASAELYDPVTGTWTATESMINARRWHTATLLPDGRVLVAGGDDADRLASAELYDPVTGTWTATPKMTEAFLGHTATLLPDGTVLVAGGDAPSGPGAIGWAHAAVYDPVTGRWKATESMKLGRLGHTATLLPDGRVLVSGGRFDGGQESEVFDDSEFYYPAIGTWSAAADMRLARSQHSAVFLSHGRVLVVGGYGGDGQATASAELFNPAGGP